ncbi:hypothetical protein [Amycolatopsis sp. cmx-4-83]|uniref:hypothetical protein n=1 Tax=Amycolatopsis sp. cmx-4-83 TaxID=2790940 RepID=UPI003979D551
MPGQIRLTEITTELLRLRDEYDDLVIATVSANVPTYEAARRARKAIDDLIDEHEDLVQIQRRYARS